MDPTAEKEEITEIDEDMKLEIRESSETRRTEDTPADPYRWVILLAAAMTMFTTGSMTYAAGVIHVALLEVYPDTHPSYLVWVGSIFMFIFGPIGPIGSVIISTFSCRTCVVISGVLALIGFSSNFLVSDPKWLILTYGLLAGSSLGLAVVGCVVILSYYFTSHIAVASGVVMCGQALGIFVHPPLMQYLVDYYGMRGAFLLLGGFAGHACVFGMLMRPSKFELSRQGQVKKGDSKLRNAARSFCTSCSSYRLVLKKGAFLWLVLACLTVGMAFGIECLYIPDYFHKGGVSKQVSSFVMSISGISSCISRLLTGVLAHDNRVGNGLTFSGLNGIIGILTFFIYTFRGSYGGALAYGFILGVYSGGTQNLIIPMALDSLGVELSAVGFGLAILANGVGWLIGPPLSNAVFLATGNYYHVFVCAAIIFLTTSVLGFLSTLSQKRAEELSEKASHSQKPESADEEDQVTVTLVNRDS